MVPLLHPKLFVLSKCLSRNSSRAQRSVSKLAAVYDQGRQKRRFLRLRFRQVHVFADLHQTYAYTVVHCQPGWKAGTKIRFPKAGNELPSGEAQDVVFVLEEKPHPQFKREDNDLVTTLQIPLVDALTGSGGARILDTLDGRKIRVSPPAGVVKPGAETRIVGEGMPIRKAGAAKNRGNLVIKWDVVFPDQLTPSQKEGVKKVLT
jgi:DnaJ-class molecular chaperone